MTRLPSSECRTRISPRHLPHGTNSSSGDRLPEFVPQCGNPAGVSVQDSGDVWTVRQAHIDGWIYACQGRATWCASPPPTTQNQIEEANNPRESWTIIGVS